MSAQGAGTFSASLSGAWAVRLPSLPAGGARTDGAGTVRDRTENAAPAPPREAQSPFLPSQQQPLLSSALRIEVDAESGRYVQKVLDSRSEAIIRQYPQEAQLAFSRAVRAYARALLDVKT